MGDEDVYVLSLVDANSAQHEAGCPDEGGPGHHEAEVEPFVAEEGLIGDVGSDKEDDDGEGYGGGNVGRVGIQRPVATV